MKGKSRGLHSFLLQAWRLAAVLGIGWSVAKITHQRQLRLAEAPVELSVAKSIFPQATQLLTEAGQCKVQGPDGTELGNIYLTLPSQKNIQGYRGPAQVAVGLAADGSVQGWAVVNSPDTPEHLEMVARSKDFQTTLHGWKATEAVPRIDGVSGATLTSMAIAEGVVRRVAEVTSSEGGGGVKLAASLKFPEPLTAVEARRLFPTTATLRAVGQRWSAVDSRGATLGWIWRGSPTVDSITGYQGPTDLLIALDPAEETVVGMRLRRSYDNEEYVTRVRESESYLAKFNGVKIKDLAHWDFAKQGIEGVSGATLTSYAVAEGMKQRAAAATPVSVPMPQVRKLAWQEWLIVAFSILGICMAWSKWRGVAWFRWVWQAAVVAVLGVWLAVPLSLHYFAGWLEHGANWAAAPGMILLGIIALLGPWSSGKQIYCHHLCPHGMVQLWLGKWTGWKWRISPKYAKLLEKLPWVCLGLAILSLTYGWGLRLATLEAFDAWVPQAANWASLTLAILGLIASLGVPQAYCKYACPTGALLKWAKKPTPGQGWSLKDTLGLAVLLLVLLRLAFA